MQIDTMTTYKGLKDAFIGVTQQTRILSKLESACLRLEYEKYLSGVCRLTRWYHKSMTKRLGCRGVALRWGMCNNVSGKCLLDEKLVELGVEDSVLDHIHLLRLARDGGYSKYSKDLTTLFRSKEVYFEEVCVDKTGFLYLSIYLDPDFSSLGGALISIKRELEGEFVEK